MNALFSDVKFLLASSLSIEKRRSLSSCLKANGGVEVSLPEATHVITNSNVFDGWQDVQKATFVVSDSWVDRSIILGQKQNPQYYSPDPRMIFSGVIACSTDLESADKEVISAGINALGGYFREGLTRDVTHLLATHSGSDKYEAALHFSKDFHIKIVLPHWFDDCYRCMMKLDEEPYTWPEPSIIKNPLVITGDPERDKEVEKERRRIALSDNKKILLKTMLENANPVSSPTRPGDMIFNDLWKGKRILLSKSLGLAKARRDTVEMTIQRGGGIIVPFNPESDRNEEEEERRVTEADILITQFRFGGAYLKAVKEKKTIGTLAWFFHVQKTGVIVRPQDQLLHYPIRKRPVEGFSNHIITVTNYSGDPRDYIKRLVTLMDAKFTPSMSAQNTIVIAAYIGGSKTEKAREWSIPVVNHLWLEDCFSEWRNLTPALDKYISFPPGINFANILAERGVGKVTYEDEEQIVEFDSREGFKSAAPSQNKQLETQLTVEINKTTTEKANDTASVSKKSPVKRAMSNNLAFPRTLDRFNSAREDMDVEEVDGLLAEDNGMGMDVDLEQETNQVVKNPSPSRHASASPKKKTPAPAPLSKSKKSATNKAKAMQELEEEEEEEEEEDGDKESENDDDRIRHAKQTRNKLSRSVAKAATFSAKAGKAGPGRSSIRNNLHKEVARDESPTPVRKTKQKSKEIVVPHLPDDDDEEVSFVLTKASEKGRPTPKRALAAESRMDEDLNAKNVGKKIMAVIKPSVFSDDQGESEAPEAESELEAQQRAPPKRKPQVSKKPVTKIISEAKTPALAPVAGPSRPLTKVTVEITQQRTPDKTSYVGTELRRGVSGTNSIMVESKNSSPTHDRPRKRDSRPHLREITPVSALPEEFSRENSGSPRNRQSQSTSATNSIHSNQRSPLHRSAATKAMQQLHEVIMPDVMSFQKEMKSGRIRNAWETGKGKGKENLLDSKKRRSSRVEAGEFDGDEMESRDAKKRKLNDTQSSSAAQSKKIIAVPTPSESDQEEIEEQTKARRWTERKVDEEESSEGSERSTRKIRLMTTKIDLKPEEEDVLEELGVEMTNDPRDCTHLVTERISRTVKFLSVMSHGAMIVVPQWVTDSVLAGKLLPESEYIVQDHEKEEEYKFKLSEALERGRNCKKKLFDGHTFYLTPNVGISHDLLKNIIESADGKVSFIRSKPALRTLQNYPERHIISSPTDKAIWSSLAEQGIPIYESELVVRGILLQEVKWDNPVFLIKNLH